MGSLGAARPRGSGISGLITAVRFLTIVPISGPAVGEPENLGRAAAWFPLVGLGLGAALALEERLLSILFPPALAALLVLVTWKLLTGGIHLDGLADSLDGLAGRESAERLAIMRDSRVGVFGAIGLVLTLLVGFVALADLPSALRQRALLLAPAVGRFAPLCLACLFSPATPGAGSAAAFMEAVTPRAFGLGALVVVLAAGTMLWPWGLFALGVGVAFSWGVGHFLSRRLDGLTGDSLGAGVEVAEIGVLLALASLHRLGRV